MSTEAGGADAEGGGEKTVEELKAELDVERQRSEAIVNQLKYARADLENLQKQIQRRIEEGVATGSEALIFKLLPVVEELDLAVEAARGAGGGLLEGVEMVRRRLLRVLEDEGVAPIEAAGRPFDPHLHEAVLEVESESHPEGAVVEEVRRGYTHRGRTLRPSMVKVAKSPGSKAQVANGDGKREG